MIEEALQAYISANIAGVAGRVYAYMLPQNVVLPAITYFVVSDVADHHMLGPSGLTEKRIQVSCWDRLEDGGGYASVKLLASQVRALLDGYQGTLSGIVIGRIFFSGSFDLRDPETKTHQVALDFIVNHDN